MANALQEPVLFAGTVRENILYGATQGTTDEDVQRAAGLANAHDFIMELAEGYDTQVGCWLPNPLSVSPFLAKGGTMQNTRVKWRVVHLTGRCLDTLL